MSCAARSCCGRRASVEPAAARHVGALLALLLFLFAAQLWIVDAAALLYSNTGPLAGASYADVHVSLPGIRLSAAAALLAAGLVVYGVLRQKLVWFAALAIATYAGVSVVFRGLIPLTEQKFVVAPNELARERTYLQQHIAATRRAWRLDSVATRDLGGDVQLTMADIRANAPTIDNVRLWERDLLKQTFGQLQEIRTYYDFASVSDDRYMIDGHYRQVHVSARELNTASLPTRNFINERLTFTHGMGIAMAPVNQVTAEGLPVLFIKDLPPVSTVSVKVTRPQIYYGELTNSYVFVGTGQKEFDYPAGEKNVYTNYTGRGGVPIGSFLRRALYAWELGSTDILLSSYISHDARILYRRNIVERAKTALPFLDFDAEPYLVVTDSGTLKWMLDAYTSSHNWPYSQPAADGTNYMRNSVKVVIDAYDGTVDAYLVDAGDPVIRTYAAIFGPIFKPLAAMPADLRAHMRYPGDLFRLQTALYATYHMQEPDAFYHREDQWQYPGGEKDTHEREPVHAAHHLAAARRGQPGIHLHDAVHPAREGQSRRVDGGPNGRPELRPARRVPVSETESRLRAEADREPHQSGNQHLAADHALGPEGLAGHSRRAARHSDQGGAGLRAAAVPARRGRKNSRAQAGGRRARESGSDGRDARGRSVAVVWRAERRRAQPSHGPIRPVPAAARPA